MLFCHRKPTSFYVENIEAKAMSDHLFNKLDSDRSGDGISGADDVAASSGSVGSDAAAASEGSSSLTAGSASSAELACGRPWSAELERSLSGDRPEPLGIPHATKLGGGGPLSDTERRRPL